VAQFDSLVISSPFNWLLNCFYIAVVLVLVYFHMRLQSLSAALILLQRAPPDQAQTISLAEDIGLYLQRMYTTASTVNPLHFIMDYKPVVSNDFHVLDLFIFCSYSPFGCITYGERSSVIRTLTPWKCPLNLSRNLIGSKSPVFELPHTADKWLIKADSFINHVSISRWKKPILHIEWPSFHIRHRLLDMPISFPSTHSLTFYQTYRLRRILSSDNATLLFTRSLNSQVYHILPLQGTTWDSFRQNQGKRF